MGRSHYPSIQRGSVTRLYEGPIGDMGDCSYIDTNELNKMALQANKVYCSNVTFLHESIPVREDCYRTIVRLNVSGFNF